MKHLTVDSFLSDENLAPWMRVKMTEVRQILSTFPEITEKIRYTVPFYDYKGMLLYMGPFQKKRLMIGFCNGVHMKRGVSHLISDAGQTQIRHFELFENKALPVKTIIMLFTEAIRTNEALHQIRK